jgi:hypothetical protein
MPPGRTGAVHDAPRGIGHEHIVLPLFIKSIAPEQQRAVLVWNVAGPIDRSQCRQACVPRATCRWRPIAAV